MTRTLSAAAQMLVLTCLGLSASACGGAAAGSGAPAPGECLYPTRGQAAKPVAPPEPKGMPTTGSTTLVLKTTAGDITVTLDRGKAPCTVNSFDSLARQGYFDDTSCHRLTTEGILVLQCGDPTGTGSGGPGYSFADELAGSESYVKGVVAMANAGADTNGSQFFLVYGDSTRLGPKYTLFGQMDQRSADLVARVATAGTSNGAPDGSPKMPVTIRQVLRR